MTRPACACGLPAAIVADVRRPNAPPARLLLCSPLCATVATPGASIDVLLEGRDFATVTRIRVCWCHLRHGSKPLLVPWCPEHGSIV